MLRPSRSIEAPPITPHFRGVCAVRDDPVRIRQGGIRIAKVLRESPSPTRRSPHDGDCRHDCRGSHAIQDRHGDSPACDCAQASASGFALRLVLRISLLAGFTRSGSLARPVSQFHSSKVSGEILPSRSSANLRRCALLLNGISGVLRGFHSQRAFDDEALRGTEQC